MIVLTLSCICQNLGINQEISSKYFLLLIIIVVDKMSRLTTITILYTLFLGVSIALDEKMQELVDDMRRIGSQIHPLPGWSIVFFNNTSDLRASRC